jgi:hypothetical protein|tara:strand:+ start:889 stop:2526 length:1638 start_codon:yes stop_codon:yes gene_type:complete
MITREQVVHLCKRKGKLKAQRGTWETHWQDLTNFVLPNSADFNLQRSKGDKRSTLIYDSTGVHSNEMLAAGLHGMLTNPASDWFSLRLKEPQQGMEDQAEVKDWLEDTAGAILSELSAPDVAFPSHIHEYYLSLCSIGTACMFIGEPAQREGISFRAIHIDEIYIAESADGIIDTVFRQFKMTVRQIVQKFGEDSLSPRIKRMYEKKDYDKEVELLHCVYPREDVQKGKKAATMLPVASVYLDEKDQHVLAEGGFDEMPYMVSRWSKAIGEVFGRSPAMTALPDIKMLQEMMKTTIKAGQKIVDPPLLVPDDGVLGPVRTIPGGLNYYRSSTGARIEPLLTGGNIPISFQMMEDLRNRIRMTFFLDQLQFQGGPQMTATEVIERTERTLRLLGPTLGRLQSEFLGPMIERIFGVLSRAGKLPLAPEILSEQQLKIEYVSPLARAQRQTETQGIMRTLEFIGPIAGMDPQAAQIVKGADTVRHIAELNGVPPKLLKSDDDLMEEAKAQQQAMAAQQQMMQGAQVMDMMQKGANVAKTAKEAGVEFE